MDGGELRLHLYGIQSAAWKSARLAEVQNDLLTDSLSETRAQTRLLEDIAEDTRANNRLLQEHRDIAGAHLALDVSKARREEEYRRIMWKETTATGQRYAELEADAKRLARWIDDGADAIRRDAIRQVKTDGLHSSEYDPASARAILQRSAPQKPAAGTLKDKIIGALVGAIVVGVVSFLAYAIYVIANTEMIDEATFGWWGLMNRLPETPTSYVIAFLPVVLVTLAGAAVGSWLKSRKSRAEAAKAVGEYRKQVEKGQGDAAAASAWLDRHEQRLTRYGFDPIIDDAARHSDWITAMRGQVTNPVDVSDLLWGIVHADHHRIDAEVLDAWEALIASVVITPTDGGPGHMLVEASSAAQGA